MRDVPVLNMAIHQSGSWQFINLALTLIFPLQPEKYLPTSARNSRALITGLLSDHGGELSLHKTLFLRVSGIQFVFLPALSLYP